MLRLHLAARSTGGGSERSGRRQFEIPDPDDGKRIVRIPVQITRMSHRKFKKIRANVAANERCHMPYLFWMVLPLAIWQTLCPQAKPAPTRSGE
jgi:hypothetical protein